MPAVFDIDSFTIRFGPEMFAHYDLAEERRVVMISKVTMTLGWIPEQYQCLGKYTVDVP